MLFTSNTMITQESLQSTIFSEDFESGLTFEQLTEAGTWEIGLSWGESFGGIAEISTDEVQSGQGRNVRAAYARTGLRTRRDVCSRIGRLLARRWRRRLAAGA